MRTRTILALVVATNLLTGTLAGVAIDRSLLDGHHHGGRGGHRHGGREPDPISAALELSPEQESQVRAILDRHHAEFEEAHAALRQRLSSVRDEVDLEIKGVVTEAQFAKLLELRRHVEQDDHDRGHGPGHDRGGPGPGCSPGGR